MKRIALMITALLGTMTAWATDYTVDNEAGLRAAIANDEAVITVTADIDLDDNNGTLSIESGLTVTIDLGGYALDRKLTKRGKNGGQVITVRKGATLNLSNGTLKGGWGRDGGGLVNEGGTVTLTDVNITGNTADDRGGGPTKGSESPLATEGKALRKRGTSTHQCPCKGLITIYPLRGWWMGWGHTDRGAPILCYLTPYRGHFFSIFFIFS